MFQINVILNFFFFLKIELHEQGELLTSSFFVPHVQGI